MLVALKEVADMNNTNLASLAPSWISMLFE